MAGSPSTPGPPERSRLRDQRPSIARHRPASASTSSPSPRGANIRRLVRRPPPMRAWRTGRSADAKTVRVASTPGLGRPQPRHDPLADQGPFVLRRCAEDDEHKLAPGRGDVQMVGRRAEGDAAPAQVIHDGEEVRRRPPEPTRSPNDEGVALPHSSMHASSPGRSSRAPGAPSRCRWHSSTPAAAARRASRVGGLAIADGRDPHTAGERSRPPPPLHSAPSSARARRHPAPNPDGGLPAWWAIQTEVVERRCRTRPPEPSFPPPPMPCPVGYPPSSGTPERGRRVAERSGEERHRRLAA